MISAGLGAEWGFYLRGDSKITQFSLKVLNTFSFLSLFSVVWTGYGSWSFVSSHILELPGNRTMTTRVPDVTIGGQEVDSHVNFKSNEIQKNAATVIIHSLIFSLSVKFCYPWDGCGLFTNVCVWCFTSYVTHLTLLIQCQNYYSITWSTKIFLQLFQLWLLFILSLKSNFEEITDLKQKF